MGLLGPSKAAVFHCSSNTGVNKVYSFQTRSCVRLHGGVGVGVTDKTARRSLQWFLLCRWILRIAIVSLPRDLLLINPYNSVVPNSTEDHVKKTKTKLRQILRQKKNGLLRTRMKWRKLIYFSLWYIIVKTFSSSPTILERDSQERRDGSFQGWYKACKIKVCRKPSILNFCIFYCLSQ